MRGSNSHIGATKKRHSHPCHVHPYEKQGKKQHNTRRSSLANSVFEELEEERSSPTEESESSSVCHEVSCPTCNPESICSKCITLDQGLNSPIGNYIQEEVFQHAAGQFQHRNATSNVHHSAASPQRSSKHHAAHQSKDSPNKSSRDVCECCHAQEDELRNTRHICDQFPVTSRSRTSKQATRDSPDYIPFHAQENGRREPQNSNYNCAKCFGTDGHLRNSLFRDMRNFYGALQWQRQSEYVGECCAHKDVAPYAPFCQEPEINNRDESSVTSCSQCRNMRSNQFSRATKNWNPYALKEGNFLMPFCWMCDTTGAFCGHNTLVKRGRHR